MSAGRVQLMMVGVVAVSLLAGCGDGAVPPGGQASAPDLEVATYEPAGAGGDAALLVGTLVNSEGCLIVEQGDGDQVLPVLPRGQARVTGGLQLMGQRYSVGDRIELTGGFGDAAPEDLPARCAGQDLPVFVVARS